MAWVITDPSLCLLSQCASSISDEFSYRTKYCTSGESPLRSRCYICSKSSNWSKCCLTNKSSAWTKICISSELSARSKYGISGSFSKYAMGSCHTTCWCGIHDMVCGYNIFQFNSQLFIQGRGTLEASFYIKLVYNPARCCRIWKYLFTWIHMSISWPRSKREFASSSSWVSLCWETMGIG
jgi:hypothetical protein